MSQILFPTLKSIKPCAKEVNDILGKTRLPKGNLTLFKAYVQHVKNKQHIIIFAYHQSCSLRDHVNALSQSTRSMML